MSWAARLASAQAKATTTATPKPVQQVFAVDPTLSEAQRKLTNAAHVTVDVQLPEYHKGLLVLDANALIKGMEHFNTIADAFVTTPQVIAEVRDKASRALLERLPHAVTVLDPTPDSLNAVLDCAERTGDVGVMSRTDIRLCALALDCCRAAKCLNPPIEPRAATIADSSAAATVVTEECSEDDEAYEAKDDKADKKDDDEGEWITPDNIHNQSDGRHVEGELFNGGVACATSDFAMQNTLLHLGVPIVSPGGMRIRELRLWLLRCTACYTIVMDTTRQFCPCCGSGDTLRRVNYVVNSKGEKRLFINFKKRISTRGTVYNLPKPRGGKRGTNRTLVLREDQLAQVIRGTSNTKAKASQVMDGDKDDELAAFGEATHRKKRNLAEPKTVSSYHRYNMNEKKKARAAHRR